MKRQRKGGRGEKESPRLIIFAKINSNSPPQFPILALFYSNLPRECKYISLQQIWASFEPKLTALLVNNNGGYYQTRLMIDKNKSGYIN